MEIQDCVCGQKHVFKKGIKCLGCKKRLERFYPFKDRKGRCKPKQMCESCFKKYQNAKNQCLAIFIIIVLVIFVISSRI
jgi:hypothetical protein